MSYQTSDGRWRVDVRSTPTGPVFELREASVLRMVAPTLEALELYLKAFAGVTLGELEEC